MKKKAFIAMMVFLLIFSFSIKTSAKINEIDDWGNCSLTEARESINNGYNVNKTDESGGSPLLMAAGFNNIEIVKILVENGAKINHKADIGSTPLMVATTNNFEITNYLIEQGAKVNVENNNGLTPLLWALEFAKQEQTIELLLENGANPNVRDNEGENVFNYLTKNEDLDHKNIEKLLNKYIDNNTTNTKKNNKYDFRNTNWGMSMEEVRNNEKQELIYNNEDLLVYEDHVINFPAEVIYIFAQNKLVRAKYLFQQKHSNSNDFIDDYKEIKSKLTQKYGAPDKDDHFWSKTLYKDDPEHWGMAIGMGHHAYYSIWENRKTTIVAFLDGENYDITLGIEYVSEEHKDLEEKEQQKEDMEDL